MLKKESAFNETEYKKSFNKNNYKKFLVYIRKDNEKVIKKLESQKSKNAYIIQLIENDLKKDNKD